LRKQTRHGGNIEKERKNTKKRRILALPSKLILRKGLKIKISQNKCDSHTCPLEGGGVKRF